uniref:Retrovirus-related Pol polyprotein from transposon TNT 1-94 n=1 Tax=Tanacetum cinerariifolium TaxID=118510 RepID=A0A6L2PA78_TANCI|nr:hypothetical protein [Tanacetum cinerariifolium]
MCLADDTKVSIPSVERPWLFEAEGFILPNHDTDESSVYSTPLPSLKKLDGVELVFGTKTIKSILKSKSTFKAEALKCVIINEPSSAPARGNKSTSASKVNSAPVIISLRRGIKPKNPQYVMKSCETCGSTVHTTTDHNNIEWFRRDEALQAKKAEVLKLTKAESSNASRSKTPTKRRQQTEETYHITFDKSLDAIKFTKPSVDNINIAESNPSDEYSEYSNHTNDEQIIDNLPITEDIQISEHLSFPNVEDTSVHDTIPIPNPSLSIPSMTSPAHQDRWSQEIYIKLVNIIGDLGPGMLTRAMAREFSAALAHECLFVDFLSKE